MPDAPSADGLRGGPRVRAVVEAARFSPREKLLLLALNAWPFVHLAATVCWATLPAWPIAARASAAAAWFLIVPPLLSRLVVGGGLPSGEIAVPSRGFFRWWLTWQLQMIFNRLPAIEEVFRLAPGLYSLWLRLWGARIGRLTLWSPGVRVFDRPLVSIGDDVVVGLEVHLVGHFGGLDPHGRAVVTLGRVTVGDRTTIGAGALLGPGVRLDVDQATEALFIGAPSAFWRGGKRVRPSDNLSASLPPKP